MMLKWPIYYQCIKNSKFKLITIKP